MAQLADIIGAVGTRLDRRGVLKVAAGASVLAAGSVALAACGGISVAGAVNTKGSASVDPSSAQTSDPKTMVAAKAGGVYDLVASGNGFKAKADKFSYYYTTGHGDTTFSCHVAKQGSTSTSALAGLMVRANGDPAAPYVAVVVAGGSSSGATFYWRATQGDTAQTWPMPIAIGIGAPIWLQIAKKGSTYTVAYAAPDATTGKQGAWSNATPYAVFDAPNYLIGLVACGSASVDEFDQVVGFTPKTFVYVDTPTASSSSAAK